MKIFIQVIPDRFSGAAAAAATQSSLSTREAVAMQARPIGRIAVEKKVVQCWRFQRTNLPTGNSSFRGRHEVGSTLYILVSLPEKSGTDPEGLTLRLDSLNLVANSQ